MNSTAQALFNLNSLLRNRDDHPEVKLGDHTFRLARGEREEAAPGIAPIEGRGGFKKVFGLEDGRAVAIPNLDTFKFDSAEEASALAATWERAIQEEKAVSDRVRSLGLEAQEIELQHLHVGDAKLPVMVMPKFSTLAERGVQVRDLKNPASSCGHSMLFGTPQNAENPERLRLAMQGLLDDAVTFIKHGHNFGGDAVSVCIKDTEKTPIHNINELGLFDERNQKVRTFLFDFSSKHRPRSKALLRLLDSVGKPDQKIIRDYAEGCVGMAYEKVTGAIRDDEANRIITLKKDYPTAIHYNNIYNIYDAFTGNYEAMKEELVSETSARITAEIERLPMSERLARFALPEGVKAEELLAPARKTAKKAARVSAKDSGTFAGSLRSEGNIGGGYSGTFVEALKAEEKAAAKSSGATAWIIGGIIAASAVVGTAIVLSKKKGHAAHERHRRQHRAEQALNQPKIQ